MKTPEQIIDAIRASVAASWQVDVTSDSSPWPQSFSVGSPTQYELEENFERYRRQGLEWQEWTADRGLELVTSLRRINGAIETIPTHVSLPTLDSAVELIGGDWTRRIERGRAHAALLRTRFPGVPGLPTVVRAVDRYSDTDFELLCAAARWFRQEPDSGLSARQVPVEGLSRRWLDVHGPLVLALAGIESLGLVERHPQRIHFSYLDPDHLAEGGRRYDSATVGDVSVPAYRPDFVLISENADTAVQIPTLSLAISVEGGGAAGAAAIASFEWIAGAGHILYWADLDAASLETVNQLRAAGLAVDTILMDLATFEKYERFGVAVDEAGNELPVPARRLLPRLTAAEQRLYERLTDPGWTGVRRIEQERIPLSAAAKAIARVLSSQR